LSGAPAEGPAFFTQFGWKPLEVRSTLKTARRLGRLSLWMRFLSLLPEPKGPPGSRPWSGICLLGKDSRPQSTLPSSGEPRQSGEVS
jgi:hypothetical protein